VEVLLNQILREHSHGKAEVIGDKLAELPAKRMKTSSLARSQILSGATFDRISLEEVALWVKENVGPFPSQRSYAEMLPKSINARHNVEKPLRVKTTGGDMRSRTTPKKVGSAIWMPL